MKHSQATRPFRLLQHRLALAALVPATLVATSCEPESGAALSTVHAPDAQYLRYLDAGGDAMSAQGASNSEFRQARLAVRSARSRVQLPRFFFRSVRPHLNCVEELEDGRLRAHWGYTNSSRRRTRIRRGWWNGFNPRPLLQGQPQRFAPGRHDSVFHTEFDADQEQTWWLLWSRASASASSVRCDAVDRCEGVTCEDNNPCTVGECDPSTGDCGYTNVENGSSCQVDNAPGRCQEGSCERIALYTAGHGDIGFEFEIDEGTGELEPHLHLEGGTVDGEVVEDAEFQPEELAIVTDASFTRPADDAGRFAQLGVAQGASVKWLPQSGNDANTAGVPFVGIAAEEIASGVLQDDTLRLSLVSVESPDNSGHYALWSSAVEPQFWMSSADGIDASDHLDIPLGHGHYNMGFANGGLGLWRVTYKVEGTLASNGTQIEEVFTINYLIK